MRKLKVVFVLFIFFYAQSCGDQEKKRREAEIKRSEEIEDATKRQEIDKLRAEVFGKLEIDAKNKRENENREKENEKAKREEDEKKFNESLIAKCENSAKSGEIKDSFKELLEGMKKHGDDLTKIGNKLQEGAEEIQKLKIDIAKRKIENIDHYLARFDLTDASRSKVKEGLVEYYNGVISECERELAAIRAKRQTPLVQPAAPNHLGSPISAAA